MTAIQTPAPVHRMDSAAPRFSALVARYGLVVVIAWIEALTFTGYEAHGIQPLVAHSPIMSWVYDIFSVSAFSAVLGVVELATALLLAVKPWWPRLSLLGSAAAIGLFLSLIFHAQAASPSRDVRAARRPSSGDSDAPRSPPSPTIAVCRTVTRAPAEEKECPRRLGHRRHGF